MAQIGGGFIDLIAAPDPGEARDEVSPLPTRRSASQRTRAAPARVRQLACPLEKPEQAPNEWLNMSILPVSAIRTAKQSVEYWLEIAGSPVGKCSLQTLLICEVQDAPSDDPSVPVI